MNRRTRRLLTTILCMALLFADFSSADLLALASEAQQETVVVTDGEDAEESVKENAEEDEEDAEENAEAEVSDDSEIEAESDTGEDEVTEDSAITEDAEERNPNDSEQADPEETIEPEAEAPADSISQNSVSANSIAANNLSETLAVGLPFKGKINNITWEINTSNRLILEGSGDYITGDDVSCPWLEKRGWITSAKVNIKGLTSMREMFWGCYNLREVDLSEQDMSKVTDMSSMFLGCTKFQGTKLPEDLDVSHVKNMSWMFRECTECRNPRIGGWDTGNVTDMSRMFEDCEKLETLDISGWDTSRVTNMSNMFDGCFKNSEGQPELDLSRWDTGNVTNMSCMFDGCKKLPALDLGNWNTGNVTNMGSMFYGCSVSALNVAGWNTGNVTNMRAMFGACGVRELDLHGWDTGSLTTVTSMFNGCGARKLNLHGWDTDSITDMSKMFYDCQSLTSLDVSGWDTSNVTDMSQMFQRCQSLTGLDVSSWDTSNVTDMSYMFAVGALHTYKNEYGAQVSDWINGALTNLNISGLDICQVTNMEYMFWGCGHLKRLNLSSFRTGNVANVNNMFSECSSLTNLDLSGFDLNLAKSGMDLASCQALTSIHTPKNYLVTEDLPGNVPWYEEDGTEHRILPLAQPDSIVLYKERGGLSGRREVFLSGITVADRVYDNTPFSYEGTAVVADAAGQEIEGVTVSGCVYSGTLMNGTVYEETSVAPTQAGRYTMTFQVDGLDESQYLLRRSTLSFWIERREAVITAPSLEIKAGGRIPSANSDEMTAKVKAEGLLEGDSMTKPPFLKYSEELSANQAGHCEIIPSGAEINGEKHPNNYRICYVNGRLAVVEPLKDLIDSGVDENIIWELDRNGKLTISGSGEYWWDGGKPPEGIGERDQCSNTERFYYPPWCSDQVKTAEIKIRDITCLHHLLAGCTNLTSVDLSGLDSSKLIDMCGMFEDCKSLKEVTGGFHTENAKYMRGMFLGCSSLEEIDLGSIPMEQAKDMTRMFAECRSLKSVRLGDLGSQENPVNCVEMFAWCTGLEYAELGNISLQGYSPQGNLAGLFDHCTKLREVEIGVVHVFDYGSVDMKKMFEGCFRLESLDWRGLSSTGRMDVRRMFSGCRALKDVNLGEFHTDGLWNFEYMFQDCSSLESLDLSGFDGEAVLSMTGMFSGCRSLRDLDLSGFDTRFETELNEYTHTQDRGNTDDMFSGCSSLESLDLSGWDTENLRTMTGMFSGCRSLKGLDLRSFDLSQIWSNSGEIFDGCTSLSYILTPKNCPVVITLPVSDGEERWTSEEGTVYTALPQNHAESMLLTKDAFLGTKELVFLSDAAVKSKVYDGQPVVLAGAMAVTDVEGREMAGITAACVYAGTLADGTPYAETAEAPSQAGQYTLSVKLTGEGADRYYLHNPSLGFVISCRQVTITAKQFRIEVGEELPSLADPQENVQYTVTGLVNGEAFVKKPALRYVPEPISAEETGRYIIEPYGAEAGNNYRIRYENGLLLIEDSGEVLPGDIPESGVIPKGLWIAGVPQAGLAYTGKAVKPEVRVYDHKTLLKEKTDYSVSYKNNVKAYGYGSGDQDFNAKKAPTITVTGKGNYAGKDMETFKILPLDIGQEVEDDGIEIFTADDMTVAYQKKSQKPLPVLWWNDKKLTNKTDYTVSYYDGSGKDKLDAVRDVGNYQIELAGKGNFTGKRRISLTVTDSLKLMSKLNVGKVKNTPYTGEAIMPELTVKDGKTVLTKDTHYTVSYSRNKEVGTAYILLRGIEAGGYSGTKRISFKITGTPIKKAVVRDEAGTVFQGAQYVYNGTDFTPELRLSMQSKQDGVTTEQPLAAGIDYTVSWQKNREAGTAAVVFTGKGAYTGTLKKTFKIKKYDIVANEGTRLNVVLQDTSIPYAKGGAKAEVAVAFRTEDGKAETLTEGKDYTLSYKNHTARNDGSNPNKLPTVTIKGKGNFKGTYRTPLTYLITAQDIGNMELTASDKTYQNKKNIYATKITITDKNGKTLKAGTDYDKNTIRYAYRDDTTVKESAAADAGTVVRKAGDAVDKKDVIPAGTYLTVTAAAKEGGNYIGTVTGEYRFTKASVSSASVSIPKQTYTGQAVTLDKSQITVRVKGQQLEESQYEIVPGSYKNNVQKGTASVTIRGMDNYGGTKTVKYSIKAKGFIWWWK
ncbi:MAG: BspA family leucine-rich repeat surface protein [Bacteroidales bacterium]|nr:BspA family leucine-rich repeat surface protein [Bacteroidales bacterium]MCM1414801.1 BspA family leucine-rich repeat surface protein [bacterium]MCM1422432.1 BspA family leucine-rich repeat surface protein [bacterium]